jgi:arylsulfatase A-like enzyme
LPIKIIDYILRGLVQIVIPVPFFMKISFQFLLVVALFGCSGRIAFSQNTGAEKPNIVWITIEDTSPYFIGCYGNTGVKTPNIDQLAKEGVRFTNAYSTNTVCAPSRFTILTGVRSSAAGTGNHRTHYNIPAEITGFPHLLKASGYYTTNNVKTDYNLAREKQMIARNWNESSNKADYRGRAAGQPFFSVFNFNESHQSRSMTNPQDWYVQNVLEKIPVSERAKPQEVIVPPFYRDSPEMRGQMVRLYNSLHLMDIKVGELIARLKAEGEWENTIVFFFGDHGQGMPGFKTHASSLGHKVPFIVRIPAKYRHLVPGIPGSTYDGLVNFEDLAPTMLSLTGNKVPGYMKGTVFLGPEKKTLQKYFWGARDNTDEVIDLGRTIIRDSMAYIRIYYPHVPTIQRHKYMDVSDIMQQIRKDKKEGELDALQSSVVSGHRAAEYLFNIRKDPWETTNLAAQPAYKKQLDELRNANRDAILKNRDVMFAPEYVLSQVDLTDTLYQFRQNDAKYPLNKIIDAAELVGKGKNDIKKQKKLLTDANSVVRYWAVTGLHNQDKNDLNEQELLTSLQNEKEDFVKIELAALLADHFHTAAAKEVLISYLKNENAALVRQALRAIVNFVPADKNLTDSVIVLREKSAAKSFKTLNYEINSCIDLILESAGIEKLAIGKIN